jgi:hypothetical protein
MFRFHATARACKASSAGNAAFIPMIVVRNARGHCTGSKVPQGPNHSDMEYTTFAYAQSVAYTCALTAAETFRAMGYKVLVA